MVSWGIVFRLTKALMPVTASSTSIQKWRRDFLEGRPCIVVDRGITLDVSCFYTFKGTWTANVALSILLAA